MVAVRDRMREADAMMWGLRTVLVRLAINALEIVAKGSLRSVEVVV